MKQTKPCQIQDEIWKPWKIKKNMENTLMSKYNSSFGNLPSCWINCQTNRCASSQRGAIIGNQCFPVHYITMQLQDLCKHWTDQSMQCKIYGTFSNCRNESALPKSTGSWNCRRLSQIPRRKSALFCTLTISLL